MKKALCILLSLLTVASLLASCAVSPDAPSRVTVTSSDAASHAEWLEKRVGDALPDTVLGIGSNEKYGVDMSDFENDGYILRESGGEVLAFAASSEGLDLAVRNLAKTLEKSAGSAAGLNVTYHEGARIGKLTIAGNDISGFTVSLPEDANENMKFASDELVRLINKATGVTLPVVIGGEVSGHVIRFDFSADKALDDDGYEYEVKNGNLYIRGAVKRGAMYAVWRFLENELNWRGLIYGEAVLSSADALDVPEGTVKSETPAFGYLHMYRMYWGSYKNDRTVLGETDVRNSYGTITNACHGIERFADEDFRAKQICYTSELRYNEVYGNVCDYIDARLAQGQKVGVDFLDVDIAQGDNSNYCTCKNCLKVLAEEGSNCGAVVRFANRLSEEINEEYDFENPLYFKIFAYAGSNQPPKKAVPNDYLYITFCTDMNCSNHTYDGSECGSGVRFNGRTNSIYADWVREWCRLTKNIYVWFYALDTALAQYTVTDTIYKDFKFFADLGVKGIFWQCQFDGLGIQRVEHQLVAEMNWNMDMTEEEFEELLMDILYREYGDGAPFIREYLDIWNAEQNTMDCWTCWSWDYHMFCSDKRFDENSVAAHFDECYNLFENAIAAADSRDQEIRLKQLSCHMIYEGCYCAYRLALDSGDEARQKVLSDRYDVMVKRLAECGFNIHAIMTVDGCLNDYEETLAEEFKNYWAGSKDNKGHGPDPWYESYMK